MATRWLDLDPNWRLTDEVRRLQFSSPGMSERRAMKIALRTVASMNLRWGK